jgi:hypothetical protein
LSRASTSYSVIVSRLEKTVGGGFRGALFGHGHLQPLDFRRHQRDALGQFLDRQQRQVLPDLVGVTFFLGLSSSSIAMRSPVARPRNIDGST